MARLSGPPPGRVAAVRDLPKPRVYPGGSPGTHQLTHHVRREPFPLWAAYTVAKRLLFTGLDLAKDTENAPRLSKAIERRIQPCTRYGRSPALYRGLAHMLRERAPLACTQALPGATRRPGRPK